MVVIQPLIQLHLHHEMFVKEGQDDLKAVVLHQTILGGAEAKLSAGQGVECIIQHACVVHKSVARVQVEYIIYVGLHESTVPDPELLELFQVVIDPLPVHKHPTPILLPLLQLLGLVLLPFLS